MTSLRAPAFFAFLLAAAAASPAQDQAARAAPRPATAASRAEDFLLLDAPYFGQTLDEPWGGDFMGDSRALVADNGCIMCCAAMVLASFGIDTDPGRLNRDLIGKGLYSSMSFRGEKLGRMGFSYESIRALYPRVRGLKMRGKIKSEADIEALKAEIRAGRPVIATVLFRKIYNHAILIYGYDGSDFLVHDPMDRSNLTLSGYASKAGNAPGNAFDCVIGTAVFSPDAP